MSERAEIEAAGRLIGDGAPVFVIAEIGASHAGDVDIATQLIEAAAGAGADAVKLQVVSPDESYVAGTPSHEIFSGLWLDRSAVEELVSVARSLGLILFSTPGSPADLQLIVDVGMPLVKISSGLLTNTPLIEEAARTGLPLILSTGMSYADEVHSAVTTAERAGATGLAILHCTALYPAPAPTLNLRAITAMRAQFTHPIGYSDHYDGVESSVAAVALGATLIEKHFTLDRAGGGPDDHFACDPDGLRQLVTAIRTTEEMLGTGRKEPSADEAPARERNRRLIVARRPLAAGHLVTRDDVAMKRTPPGSGGLEPAALDSVLGSRTRRAVAADEYLNWEVLER